MRFPRSMKLAVDRIISLATLDSEAASECVYALPRGGKPIRGPSVRFAEIVGAMYGNCHIGSRIVAVGHPSCRGSRFLSHVAGGTT